MKKKLLSYLFIWILIWSDLGLLVYANPTDISVYLNNKQILYTQEYGFPFIDENSRTQVPFRLTLESFGAQVEWDQDNQTAIATKGDVTVRVPIGSVLIYRNDEPIINDTEPVLINGRVFIPIRVVMEAFGCDVAWVSANQGVYIDYEVNQNVLQTIPRQYDLRSLNRVTSVRNQGAIGACWAFAAIGAIESVLMPEERWNFSEDNLSLGHGYNLAQNEGGDHHVAMSYFAGWKGPVLESADPYGDGVYNPNAKVQKHIQEMLLLKNKDYASIKYYIMQHGGVESAMYLDYQLFNNNSVYYEPETAAYYYNGSRVSNHDVLIVGWDDGYSRDNFNRKPLRNGAFICKNSYGTSFGDEGYFYVSYEDVRIGQSALVYSRIESTNNYENIYQYDDLGWVGTVGYGNDTAYFANVFTPKNPLESLRAVGFYATDKDSTYEVYVVRNYKSTEDMSNRLLVARGQLKHAGYYTIDFDAPVRVSGRYSVMVKITTPGSTRPVAVEIQKDVPWLGTVRIDDGFGLLSPDGRNFSRSETVVQANIALKAFSDTVIYAFPSR